MFKNISLTLSGVIFAIVIATVYFQKKKYEDVENNIYRFLTFWTLALLFLEIACDIIISFKASFPILTETLCRLYILGDVVWFISIITYMKVVLSPKKYSNVYSILSEKSMMFLTLFASSMYFLSCFLPLSYHSGVNGEFNVIGGKAVYVLYVVFAFVGGYMTKVLFKNLNHVTLIKRLPILLFLAFYFVLGVFQLLYADINDLTFLFAFCIVSMYFTLENQEAKLVNELEISRKKAEAADKSKTEFLSKMSHEIRTPMNAIMGFSESLLNKETLEEQETKEEVKNIYSAGKSLLEIINNILLFSRIESEKETVENNEYAISDITSELDSFAVSKIDKSKVKFNINIDDNIPLNYVGDKLKIYRILSNLISNSINNTSNGSINLNISCKIFGDNIGLLTFEVKDTGIGMKEEELNRIINEFSTTDSENFNIKGTGLGLLIVKKLVDMLDAKISFESEYEIGSCFKIEITQKIVGTEKIKDFKRNNILFDNEEHNFDCSNVKILVVDDNALNRKVTEKLLKTYNANVETVDSGNACIESIKQGRKYDLIFLDHMMPNIDGIDTFRILKKMKLKVLPPVIIMTANIASELKEMYKKEGFNDYLSKPVDTKELNKIMIKYLKKGSRG